MQEKLSMEIWSAQIDIRNLIFLCIQQLATHFTQLN